MTNTEKYALIYKLADELGVIILIWATADVLSIRPDLTEEQAAEVLAAADRRHDANIGINWDVLECHAEWLFPSNDEGEAS
jgi:hypothetical protein